MMCHSFIPLSLIWFSKKSEKLMGEEMICIDLHCALQLLNIDPHYDPILAYSYKITEELAKNIQPYFKHTILLDKYLYYAESYGNYECRNGVPVEVPYDPSRYRLEVGSEDENDA